MNKPIPEAKIIAAVDKAWRKQIQLKQAKRAISPRTKRAPK